MVASLYILLSNKTNILMNCLSIDYWLMLRWGDIVRMLKIQWIGPKIMRIHFLQIVYKKVKWDPNGAPTFKPSNWHNMDEELFLVVGKRYRAERLKGKYQRLRIKHRLFSDLFDHTGVTYNSNLNTVKAREDVWQLFYKVPYASYENEE